MSGLIKSLQHKLVGVVITKLRLGIVSVVGRAAALVLPDNYLHLLFFNNPKGRCNMRQFGNGRDIEFNFDLGAVIRDGFVA